MTEGDFLRPFLALHPAIVALVIWVWGFGSLVLVGLKTQTLKASVFKNIPIMVGDFFLLPLSAALIVMFYQSVENPLKALASPLWGIVAVAVAVILTLISASRFKLLNRWWLLHSLFYFFLSYLVITFFLKGIYQLTLQENSSPFLWAQCGSHHFS